MMTPTSSSKVIQLRYCDPEPIAAAQTQPEQRELLAQGPAVSAEHDPGTEQHGADAGIGRRVGPRPPRPGTPRPGIRRPDAESSVSSSSPRSP